VKDLLRTIAKILTNALILDTVTTTTLTMAPKRQTLVYENEDLDRIPKFQGRGKHVQASEFVKDSRSVPDIHWPLPISNVCFQDIGRYQSSLSMEIV
jgi:hypothetical protein